MKYRKKSSPPAQDLSQTFKIEPLILKNKLDVKNLSIDGEARNGEVQFFVGPAAPKVGKEEAIKIREHLAKVFDL